MEYSSGGPVEDVPMIATEIPKWVKNGKDRNGR